MSNCRPCSECAGNPCGHHFSDMYVAAEECVEDGPDVGCKHCDTVADVCPEWECDAGVACEKCDSTGFVNLRKREADFDD